MLHLKPDGQVTATNKNIQSETERVYFRLVPILANGPNGRVVETVALLDSASDISLIDVDLCKDLGLKGEKSSLAIKTLNSVSKKDSKKVSLDIKATDDLDSPILHIKEAWTMNSDAFCCPPQITRKDWKHITQLNIPHIDPSQVKLLIGLNVPEAHIQTDVVAGEADQPYAVRTMIGWSIMGVSPNDSNTQSLQATVKLTVSKDIALHEQVERFWKTESFGVAHDNKHSVSAEDRRAQRILDNTTRLVDGHYEVGMLWKHDDPKLPNNQFLAEKRLRSLARRLVNDKDFACVYADTLNGYVSKGFASKITDTDNASSLSSIWYLPHHGVTNPNKPGKVRVVFDAAADFSGTSLNDNLLTGPDLLNSLFGLLARFRLFSVVITADIEAMFHQVSVPDSDSNTLRFLWKQDFSKPDPPEHYKMNVHIFGAADSPCCANYAVKRTAKDNADMFSSTAVDTVLNDFYVDDLLKAIETPTEAISLSRELTQLMKLGGFRLHKWISNSPEVLNTIPESERSIQPVDLDLDQLPVQRALGLKWDVNDDCFIFGSKRKEVVFTKRGTVSLVSTIFDPAGFLAPFTFRAKCLIQDLWRERLDWDDPIPENHRKVWSDWLSELDQLSTFTRPRHHPHMSSKIDWIELHIFCDASEKGFGAAAYLRYSVKTRGLFCSFVASKTHVAPVKNALSIPRLELQGAVIGTRLCNTLKTELKLTFQKVTLWTDSNTILQYLNNETRRFKPFVCNRVSEILESTSCEQWKHVPSMENPADHCTRGLRGHDINLEHQWFRGPTFLCTEEQDWTVHTQETELDRSDPEVKTEKRVLNTSSIDSSVPMNKSILTNMTLGKLMQPADFSSWHRLCRRTGWILRAAKNFLSGINGQPQVKDSELLASEYDEAQLCWIQEAQRDGFPEEIDRLKSAQDVPLSSKLLPLSPVYDGRYLRVGGRLSKASVPFETKFQFLLPVDHVVSRLIMEDVHLKTAHGGSEHMLSKVRERFWPISARRLAKEAVRNCISCYRQQVKPVIPKMADLPTCRLSGIEGPFVHTGADYFGPMYVKQRRSTVKRWGCLFTCLSIRAVHIELADSLETDDFMLVLKNFINRRGHPKHIFSDNGTNFKGADNELRQCLEDLKQDHINRNLSVQGTQWHFIPPQSPQFGGAWERLVRSVKRALRSTLGDKCIAESTLRTALIEIEGTLNSRPLTHNSADANDFTPLTPNHFLIGRADIHFPFCDSETNSRKRWRQAQVLADLMNRRWLKEYLPQLAIRHRWTGDTPAVSVGDLVLLAVDNVPPGQWNLGRILEVLPGDDGRIRTVRVKTVRGEYVRPSAKICVLEENVSEKTK